VMCLHKPRICPELVEVQNYIYLLCVSLPKLQALSNLLSTRKSSFRTVHVQ
jgi:hypothetical protein